MKNKTLMPTLWDIYKNLNSIVINSSIHSENAIELFDALKLDTLRLIAELKLCSKRDREIKIKALNQLVNNYSERELEIFIINQVTKE